MNFATLVAFATSQLCHNDSETLWLLPPESEAAPPSGLPNVVTRSYCDKPLPDGHGYPLPPNLCDEFCLRTVGPHIHSLRASFSAGLEALLRLVSNPQLSQYPYSPAAKKRFAVIVLDRPLGKNGTIASGVDRWNTPRAYPPQGESTGGFGASTFARWDLLESWSGILPRVNSNPNSTAIESPIACKTTEELRSQIFNHTSAEDNQEFVHNSVCYLLEYIKYVKHLRAFEHPSHQATASAETTKAPKYLISLRRQLGPDVYPEVSSFVAAEPCYSTDYPDTDLQKALPPNTEVLLLKDAGAVAEITDTTYTLQQYHQAVRLAQGRCSVHRKRTVAIVGVIVGSVTFLAVSLTMLFCRRRKDHLARARLSSVAETRYYDAATSSEPDNYGPEGTADRFQWFDRVTLSMFE